MRMPEINSPTQILLLYWQRCFMFTEKNDCLVPLAWNRDVTVCLPSSKIREQHTGFMSHLTTRFGGNLRLSHWLVRTGNLTWELTWTWLYCTLSSAMLYAW
jgi:hypothetical protein